MSECLDMLEEVFVQPEEEKAKGSIFCPHLLQNHPLGS